MEIINDYGVLSLIPAFLAVFLAFKTKNVVLSLLISLMSGTLILSSGNPWTALQMLFSKYLFVDLAAGNNPQTIIMMSIIGGFVALIEKSGGAQAFAKYVSKSVNTRTKAQVFCWLGGLAIFFSDSGNSLMLGPIFRPIFDKLKISREKLSYILDSTSSPVCILLPITGWGVYITSIIASEFKILGINESDMSIFFKAIPYQFYAILALLLIPIIAIQKKEFGYMAKAEHRTLYENKIFNDYVDQNEINKIEVIENGKKTSTKNIIIPLGILFAVILIMFISWGFPTKNIPGSKIRIALTSGYLVASIAAIILIVKDKIMTFEESFSTFIGGIQRMASILVVIVIAWGVGSVSKDLGTSNYVVNSTLGILTPNLIPAFIFIIGVVISFATGTSWGTFAILLPLGIQMAHSFEASIPLTIAAVLSGGLFGDHCSPISDTTIMSSMAAECNHLDHVKTQLPCAGIAAAGSFVTYLIVGFINMSSILALGLAIVITIIIYTIACKVWGESFANVKNTEE